MLRSLYLMALRIYPKHHREAFGEEMLAVFEAACADLSSAPVMSRLQFLLREGVGLIRGGIQESFQSLIPAGQASNRQETAHRFSKAVIYGMPLLLCLTLVGTASFALIALHASLGEQPIIRTEWRTILLGSLSALVLASAAVISLAVSSTLSQPNATGVAFGEQRALLGEKGKERK